VDKPKVTKTVVIYSGRFQPFHKGHYAAYEKLVSKFGKDNVYIATSNKTDNDKSPFNFKEKVIIMGKMFGIPPSKIVQVANPYSPKEVLSKFDGKTTQYIAAVGEKDANRLQGKYFKPYNGKAGYGYDEIGYTYIVPPESNPISGTDVRKGLGGDEETAKKFFTKAYPKFDKDIFKMITKKLNEGFPGGIGVGLNLPNGYINGAPTGSVEESNNTNPSSEMRPEPHPTRHEIEYSNKDDYYDPIAEQIAKLVFEADNFIEEYFLEEEPNPIMDKEISYTSKDGKKKKITVRGALRLPKDHEAHIQAAKLVGPKDAPVNEPKGKAATQSAKPAQPGQPVKKGQTAQGKIDGTPNGGEQPGQQAPPPEQKLSGAELKSSAEKKEKGGAASEVKEKLHKAKAGLSEEDRKAADDANNPESEMRKGWYSKLNDWTGKKLHAVGKAVGHVIAHKVDQYKEFGKGIYSFATSGKLGTIKDPKTGKKAHWSDYTQSGSAAEGWGSKMKEVPVYKKDKHGHDVHDENGNPVQATDWRGRPKTTKEPVFREDLSKHELALAKKSWYEHQEQKKGLIGTAKDAAIMCASMMTAGAGTAAYGAATTAGATASTIGQAALHGATSAFTHGAWGFGAHLGKDMVKHVAFEAVGANAAQAGVGGAALSIVTGGLAEGVDSTQPNPHNMMMNLIKKIGERMATFKMSDEQMLASIESYKKNKPEMDAKNAAMDLLREDLAQKKSKAQTIGEFIKFATHRLELEKMPFNIQLVKDNEFATLYKSFGGYDPHTDNIYVYVTNRSLPDILRTLAHELVHLKQRQSGYIGGVEDGATGSDVENEANAAAGILLRDFGKLNSHIYEDVNVDVDKGDVVLMGKFKNKKVQVKDIGKDDHGMPTINGKQATTFRTTEEMAKADLDSVERYADRELSPADIEFSKHFFDRVNDARNGKDISEPELTGFFKRLASKHKKEFLNLLDKYNQIVVKDSRSDINIPFVKMANKVIAKTIMRKGDFQTSSKTITNEAFTKGQLYAGNLKINGVVVPIEVELIGADNKTNQFITKIIHIDSKYFHKFPIGSTLPIPARIFRFTGGWRKIKTPSAFKESLNEVKWEDSAYDKCMLGKLPLSLNIIKKIVEPIRTTSLHATDIEHLPQVDALQGKQKSISTFTKTTKWGKLVQGKGMHTKGGIIVALSGTVLAQSIMDLWTEPDKKGMRWVNPGTIISGLGREQDVVFNFAPELKPYKEDWKKNMYDNPATNKEKAEFIKKYIDAADRYMLSKKKEFQDKYLNSNGLYYDSDWNEVVLNQIKIESILVVPWLLKTNVKVGSWDFDMENKEDTEKTIQKLKQKYPRVVVAKNEADIANFITTNGGSIINESVNQSKELIMEGGAYGHMNHPFDISMNLTFGDLKKIINNALDGNLGVVREKTDGQALAISWKNGRLIAARNKGHLANSGENALDAAALADKFNGRGALADAYNFAMKDLYSAISGLGEKERQSIFKDGSAFCNLEVIYPENANVIPYGQNLLVFHNVVEYDEKGNAIGGVKGAESKLASMIKKVNADVQSKYTIQGPPITKLPKDEKLSSQKGKFNSMLSKLQSEFNLGDKDGVADYHYAWWMNFVNKSKKNLAQLEKEGLARRWAFDNKSFTIKSIADEDARKWAEGVDKDAKDKIMKGNLRKFEDIFLGVGAEVLSFMGSVLTAQPDSALQSIRKSLESSISDIRSGGSESQIKRLEKELARLNAIGGFDKLVPNEGLVFFYKGNTYKLTGTFAPLNQILGIFKFGR
jgi:hypothetical protein